MKDLKVPEFASYEEEAAFWDNLDTADYMVDDGEWFRFDVPNPRAVRIAIVPEIARQLRERARAKGVTVETLVNVWLMERLDDLAQSSPQPSVAEPRSPYATEGEPAP